MEAGGALLTAMVYYAEAIYALSQEDVNAVSVYRVNDEARKHMHF